MEDAALMSDALPDRRLTTKTTLLESLGSEVIVQFPLGAEPFSITDAEFEGEDAIEAA